ncbi:hydrolase [Mariniblastus fucicola]|uniref:hydrolase n=1 Tax=Mariniblastus fucicola TaxID=980251 RepID=UPI0013906952|nr:hydrolase [Mariniblastus fucicola]
MNRHAVESLQWLDDKQDSMLNLIVELCDINSGTFNLAGIQKVRERLIEEFSTLGGELEVVESEPWMTVDDRGVSEEGKSGPILHVTKWPEAETKVMLCIHMDTVYGPDSSFQKCVTRQDGTVNGPGVIDAKGGIVVMLNALKTLEASSLAGKIGWEVILNSDEEIGSRGSDTFIRSRAGHCVAGLLFEPSLPDGTLVSWRKGSGNFAFIVRGRSAHTGRDFAKGRNALAALSRLCVEIDELNTDPDITYNVGRINGGGALNAVPDLAVGRVNVRVVDTDQQKQVEEKFASLVAKYNEADGISVEMSGEFSSPPKPIDDGVRQMQSRIESCGEALGMEIKWRGTGGASDGNRFAAAGLPNIDTLGPCGDHIHSDQEFLIPESLVPRAKLAALVLMSFAAP